jgi:hypothetical protein
MVAEGAVQAGGIGCGGRRLADACGLVGQWLQYSQQDPRRLALTSRDAANSGLGHLIRHDPGEGLVDIAY